MPSKQSNGKRDTQKTEQGYEIPVPKRKDVFDILDKAAKKSTAESKPTKPKRRK